jgi:hypothetical protein
MITLVTIVFFALVTFIFWLGGLAEKGKASGHAPAPVIAGSSDGAPPAPSEASPGMARAKPARE